MTLLQEPLIKTAFQLYQCGWRLATPLLRKNSRLLEGFEQRTLFGAPPKPADLWIQAASGGEAYLAGSLVQHLKPSGPMDILITTNTRQGMDIIERAMGDRHIHEDITITPAYFPFDRPDIMERAVKAIRPKVMVLLETEIWPGLLRALKNHPCKTAIVNGRITPKSWHHYRLWPALWTALKPDKVLAVSENDAHRFATLFTGCSVEVMFNIKFDRLDTGRSPESDRAALDPLISPDIPVLVLGSTRKEEEGDIEKMIRQVRENRPGTQIALFPRHLHRIPHWQSALDRLAVPWTLRSTVHAQLKEPMVILWDTFGELNAAYARADAVFVGGSLAPLGGQNFLEPLTHGCIPVIGPSWENFHWVGEEILHQGLVKVAPHWQEAARMLLDQLASPPSKAAVREHTIQYVKKRQGGSRQACRLITHWLDTHENARRRLPHE